MSHTASSSLPIGSAPLPYWRLSGLYFFYFAVIGALMPYWGLYLEERGYSPQAIGSISAIIMATRIVAPNLWGWLGDKTGRRLGIIRLGAACSAIAFIGVFFGDDFWWMAGVIALYTFFWNALLPQFEVVTLAHLGKRSHHYSRIRLWGSIGFIVSAAGLGVLFDWFSINWLPWFMLLCLVLISANGWLLSERPQTVKRASDHQGGLKAILQQPVVLAFFAASFLLQLSFGPFYAFYSIYLEDYGYSRSTIGALWTVGVIAEIIIFLVMHRWLPRFGVRRLLLLSLWLTAVRWLLTALLPESLWVMITAQCLHAFSFGVAHSVSIELIGRFFGDHHQGQGQALYSGFSFGLGGAIGAAMAGLLWDWSASLTYGIAAMSALLASGIVFFYLRDIEKCFWSRESQ